MCVKTIDVETQQPLVSVIMGVHNGHPFVESAVESVLAQTYLNWELIIVDDGSTDGTLETLKQFAAADRRIKVLENSNRLGLAFSLNRCISNLNGVFCARFDADDIMFENRLECQAGFLKSRPDVGLVGSYAKLIDSEGDMLPPYDLRAPRSNEAIVWAEVTGDAAAFIHPSVMMRVSVLVDFDLRYDEGYDASQDKRLWYDVLAVAKGANIPEPLIFYRQHQGAISRVKRALQERNARQVRELWLGRMCELPIKADVLAVFFDLPGGISSAGGGLFSLFVEILGAIRDDHSGSRSLFFWLRLRIVFWIVRFGGFRPNLSALIQGGVWRILLLRRCASASDA